MLLINVSSHTLGSVWLNGHKVVGDDGHVVAIKGELLNTLSTSVDETQSMNFSRSESEVGDTSIALAWSLVGGR